MTNLHVLKSAPSSGVGTVGGVDFITIDPKMLEILEMVKRFALADYPVLILGETGTGKELIFKMIHAHSPRCEKEPFVQNCAALPESLVESELFGYVRGAFSGATTNKIGLFEDADGSTVFLDEMGEISLDLQAKLLRVLGENAVKRLGAKSEKKFDFRIICATNVNIRKMVADGKFRQDLFQRINVFPIELPPLRERVCDIPLLVSYFVKKKLLNLSFSEEAMEALMAYRWPGNVRELENLVVRLPYFVRGQEVGIGDLPKEIFSSPIISNLPEAKYVVPVKECNSEFTELPSNGVNTLNDAAGIFDLLLDEVIDFYCRGQLKKHNSVSGAARAAGKNRSTFASILKKRGIEKDD